MGNRTRIWLVTCLALGLTARETQRVCSATYAFTQIARANSGLGPGVDFADIHAYGADPGVSINNAGVVAFRAAENNIVSGVYYSSGGAITQVADNDAGSSWVAFHGTPSINSANQVAFKAALDPTTSGIFRGDGGPVTTIATTSPSGFGGLGEKPAINSSGNVAFLTSPAGAYVGAGGAITPMYVSGDGKGVEPLSDPAINDLGQIAFLGSALGVHGIHRGSGGAVTTIADVSGGFFTGLGDAAMNVSSSSVAWWSYTATGEGIFEGVGGAPTPVADNLGAYSGFSIHGDPSVSAAGIAFFASLDGGGHGLFTGADPVADRVIQTGDALLGSTVASLQPLARSSMNDLGQIGFVATLSNGDIVVARANPFPGPLPLGDYNESGDVEAADFVLWREYEGTDYALPNDAIGGTIGDAQYDQWRAHFGQIAAAGSILGAATGLPTEHPLQCPNQAVSCYSRLGHLR